MIEHRIFFDKIQLCFSLSIIYIADNATVFFCLEQNRGGKVKVIGKGSGQCATDCADPVFINCLVLALRPGFLHRSSHF